MFRTTKERGFTLIELLVVIAIIGILSSVVLASLNSARQKGRDARRVSDLKQIQLALELNYDANQTYPLSDEIENDIVPTYISSLPVDPSSDDPYEYFSLSSSGTTECTSEPCVRYVLGATVEGTKPAGGHAVDYSAGGGPDCTDAQVYCVVP
ncbi:MAG TPA: type II secretion system protein [Candidatus Paceibacterota bacterium]|nr:type II secretion system protein [Candidatus Paceibacterota bacterium]